MHFSGRGFVHLELIDPATGAAKPIEDGAEGELVLTHLVNRSAPLLRFRTRDHVRMSVGPLRLRPHGAARALHRPHRRHADRARSQRVSLRRAGGGQRIRASGHRSHHDPPAREGRPPGAAAAGRGRSRAGRGGRGPRRAHPRAAARQAAGDDGDRARRRRAACRAANTNRSSSKKHEEESDAKASDAGSASHHAGRRRPPDLDRLLGGRARHALRVRAAQSRQRRREPHLFRSRRRAADHRLHPRGPQARPPPHADRHRLRAPYRLQRLARRLHAGGRAARTRAESRTPACATG